MKAIAIFFFNVLQNILGITFGWLFGAKPNRYSYKTFSNLDKVKYLEKRREFKGYNEQWLYYRCREEGLLDAYHKLFKTETAYKFEATKFSFGKYKGEFIEAIWESDNAYIRWLSQQKWLAQYLYESDMIHELLQLEKESYS